MPNDSCGRVELVLGLQVTRLSRQAAESRHHHNPAPRLNTVLTLGKTCRMSEDNEIWNPNIGSKTSILVLDRDVWLEILLHFDDPRDILCLRMVSKWLQLITLEMGVWNRFLRTQCAVNYVPSCTFPFSDMDRHQLERVTTRPYRMIHKLLSPDPMCIMETVLRLYSVPTSEDSADETILDISVIAGGRYVVTASSAQKVVVWDLGLSSALEGGPESSPQALAVIDAPERLFSIYTIMLRVLPTKDSSSYRVVLGVDTHDTNDWK
ncbi:hypothetical protein DL93DRAFT_1946614 [Clavulina sp. PMI_390]|nr:hypothetical protein DL93DRAFT_1946614 [Clavulina sp. PMI_390]